MYAYVHFILRLSMVTTWFTVHAFHCGIDWAHHAPAIEHLLHSVTPIAASELAPAVALFSATTLTAIDIVRARSLFSFSCTTTHALNIVMGWSLFDPAFGHGVLQEVQ